jgi:hypothetical protein
MSLLLSDCVEAKKRPHPPISTTKLAGRFSLTAVGVPSACERKRPLGKTSRTQGVTWWNVDAITATLGLVECPECVRLRAEYDRLKQGYGRVVALLFEIGYKATDAEHKQLREAAAEARLDSENARIGFERHQRTHRHQPEKAASFNRSAEIGR